MRQVVPRGAVVGFLGVLALLGALQLVAGIGVLGWAVGLACGAVLNVLLAWGLVARGQPWLGPADRVTLGRAVLACGIAALTAYGFVGRTSVALVVALAATALSLDVADGWVARRTGTTSALGARFDMESDAFLILVLSVHVAPAAGWWVLAGGAARYALIAASWCAPWLGRPTPARPWRKLVAGLQGVVLTVAASAVLAPTVTVALVASGMALLALSFGTQIASLRRLRAGGRSSEPTHPGAAAQGPRASTVTPAGGAGGGSVLAAAAPSLAVAGPEGVQCRS